MLESDSNCIGYAYHRLGVIDEEELVFPPKFEEVKKWFDEVPELTGADAVGVLCTHKGHTEQTVVHLAVVDKESSTRILHRQRAYGPVMQESFEEGLEIYLRDSDTFRLVYLTAKPISR